MTTLVITGGIGSGKSAVSAVLEKLGVPVYDSDSRTKALYDSSPSLVARLEEVLGTPLRREDGSLDRAALASAVFPARGKMALAESVVHPAVLEDFLKWRDGQNCNVVGFESAIILEKPLFAGLGDFVLLVDAPVETRIERVMRRSGLSRGDVLSRLAGQKLMNDISEGRVKAPADFVIVNDGALEDLEGKVVEAYEKIVKYTR